MTIWAAMALAAAASAPVAIEIEAAGPAGPLRGTLLAPTDAQRAPVVLILPGSGATDRDGNNPMAGVRASPYRLLAEGLAERGIATIRIDKRGILGSAGAGSANAVTIADYAADTRQWVRAARERTGARCVWLLGHSEGGLIALAAGQNPEDLCGLILVSAAGRPMGSVLREQLRANPANAPLLDDAFAAIASLEAGRRVEQLRPELMPLFAPPLQGYWIDLLSHDPAQLSAQLELPVLIVQGLHDLHVNEADARRLAGANPAARLVLLPAVNHVLKVVATDDRAANAATYGDPSLPLAPGVVEAIADFIGTAG